MREFNLEEYLKNPQRKIVTRDGRNVRIICVDRKFKVLDEDYPIIALVESLDDSDELSLSLICDGKETYGLDSCADLFFAPIKKEGWVNLFKINSTITTGEVYNTEEEAKSAILCKYIYISTTKIEWEE